MVTRNSMPLARAKDIIVQQTEDECLVYDLNTNKALCLNTVSAEIWRRCDGVSEVCKVAEIIGKQMDIELGDDFIWLVISDLEKNKLLESKVNRPTEFENLSRRKVLFKYALPSLMLPVIASVIAPIAVDAASVPPCLPAFTVLGFAPCVGAFNPAVPNAACCGGMQVILLLPPGPPGFCNIVCT